jgi:hypothetical protein
MNGTAPAPGPFEDPLVSRITGFLLSIGVPVARGDTPECTFLPGIEVRSGVIIIDEIKLLYPGDLLHEAGHLAMLPPSQRASAQGHLGDNGGFEMAAIGWSYAAAIHLALPPAVVFHEAGYRGGSGSLLENFAAGRYLGVPMLEWVGLTVGERRAKALGIKPYPSMLGWVREEPAS